MRFLKGEILQLPDDLGLALKNVMIYLVRNACIFTDGEDIRTFLAARMFLVHLCLYLGQNYSALLQGEMQVEYHLRSFGNIDVGTDEYCGCFHGYVNKDTL